MYLTGQLWPVSLFPDVVTVYNSSDVSGASMWLRVSFPDPLILL